MVTGGRIRDGERDKQQRNLNVCLFVFSARETENLFSSALTSRFTMMDSQDVFAELKRGLYIPWRHLWPDLNIGVLKVQ